VNRVDNISGYCQRRTITLIDINNIMMMEILELDFFFSSLDLSPFIEESSFGLFIKGDMGLG
jgi:hypothetical protein